MAKTETVPTTVTMDDGRVVDFPGNSRLLKSVVGDNQVRLDFISGETRLFTIRPDMQAQFALHGALQKLGDEISGIKDIDDAIEAIDQLMQRLDAGQWTATREAGSGMAGASILARALVEVTKQPIAVVREYLGKLDMKTKAALRVSPEVKPTVDRLEAEKAARAAARGKGATTVDTSAVLAGLMAPAE